MTLTWDEIPYDLAIIGTSAAVGDELGWFTLAPGFNDTQWAHQLGYPSAGSGLMTGLAWVQRDAWYSLYTANAATGSDIMGPGSSGGPLYLYDQYGGARLIGVKTSGSATTSQWADIDLLYPRLLRATVENNFLLNPTRTPVIEGTSAGDTLFFTPHLEQVIGGLGTDTLVYSSQYASYQVRRQEGIVLVDDLQDSGGPAQLTSVERLAFTNGTLALDVGAGETAGTLYRLYQAAFARAPDQSGLNYWIDTIDRGLSAEQAAFNFVTSSEFAALYGQHPSDELLLTR